MKRVTKYLLPAVLWCVVAIYIIFAARISRSRFAETTIDRIEIEIVDSTAGKRLVTTPMVREWIARSGLTVEGAPVGEVDFAAIERTVAENGFVDDVAAYGSAEGVLYVEVSQRTPMVRLLVDGYNRYVTPNGFVFGTPASSAVYVPVITGSYVPPFPSGFEGFVRSHTDTLLQGSQGLEYKIRVLKHERDSLLGQRSGIYARKRALDRKRPKKSFFETESKWKEREEWELSQWNEKRRQKTDSIRRNEEIVARLSARIDEGHEAIKKTYKKYEDFVKLLNFVERIEDDSFWRAEIVQIVVDPLSSGEMRVLLIPRSGSFTIEFGEIADVDDKFDRLMRFYREGLRNIGWDEYSSISVAYDGQVVCRK